MRRPGPPEITCGIHCGSERWRIKTASDPEARTMNWTPQPATIADLVELPAPRWLEDDRADAEKRVYSVEAILIGWKSETGQHGDQDFHLVLADPEDPGRTMIAEVPSGECVGACSSLQAQQFARVREMLESRLSSPEAHFRRFHPAWLVRVDGAGFFDIFHGQIGVAANCIELHPVVRVEFLHQLDPGTPLPRRVAPPAEHRCGISPREDGEAE